MAENVDDGGFSSILSNNRERMDEISTLKNSKVTGKARNVGFGIILIGILLMFIVFAAQIITGMFALVLTLVVSVGGFLGLRWLKTMDPLIRQKTLNMRLEKMIGEARERAMEQLQNQVMKNADRLANAKEAIIKVGALINKMESKINPADAGSAKHTKKLKMKAKIEEAHDAMKQNYVAAQDADLAFKAKVHEYREMDEFADIVSDAQSIMNSAADGELEELLSLEAFGQIETNFHTAVSSLEASALEFKG
ncbi:MAG: hypothetical protein OEX12_00230 [Gammaproteobacteria bacterium]|nr:hypothetical protein [Gammaproteobacteria bacterium]